MKTRYLLLIALFFIFASTIIAQTKIPLDHTVYDDWKSIANTIISNDGSKVVYKINPQEGDGNLFLYDVSSKSSLSFSRGDKPKFSPNSNLLIYNIVPQYDTVREAKLKKVKKDKLPKDSLGIFIISSGVIKKYADLKKVQVPDKGSNWLAFTVKMPEVKKDTTQLDSIVPKKKAKSKKKGKDKKSNLLVLMNPITGDSVSFRDVTKFSFSKNGELCSFIQVRNDSIDSVTVTYYNTVKKKSEIVFNKPGYAENIVVDGDGKQMAFTYSGDTIKEKAFGYYYFNLAKDKLVAVVDTSFSSLTEKWSVSTSGSMYFNESGSELYFGTQPKPIPAVKDTLTDDEKVSVDIWNWKDIKLQPQQLKELKREKKRSYVAVYYPSDDKLVQLANEKIKSVKINKKSKGSLCLGFDYEPYTRMTSWEANRFKDVYLINKETGSNSLVLSKLASSVVFSPDEDFIVWYNIADSSWNSYNIKTKSSVNLTGEMDVNFYNEINDIPNEASPYGFCGWTQNGDPVIYDEFDLWRFDPTGKKQPVVITEGVGRNNKIRFRYVKLDKELQYLPELLMLSAFNKVNKDAGYYSLNLKKGSSLSKLIVESYRFTSPIKAKNAEEIIWKKQSFTVFPDLYVSNLKFENINKITDANPKQSDYNWGEVKLVDWVSFNGDSMKGMLYTPEDMDPNKKYPMLVYFYERYSDRLHSYHVPKPIRSVINFSYYVSNGYIIFVPDIVYRDGYPGPSAYDCIVSGTQTMCDEFDFIDRDRMGIQGQSWGGYQVAYLVTQTNMYRAAMAGAPVSNMTSAYGGIRWGSGMSRAFQYEHTQSRIGGDLWEKLPLYMLNSPLFSADRIETPLLIMHNDKDGAVPWYQGIEMFNAMRRLNKPVWMLVYNGAPHNLSRRADCKDLTIRMQQFFDFYLKDAPEPVWMKYGVPALNKGKCTGFGLED